MVLLLSQSTLLPTTLSVIEGYSVEKSTVCLMVDHSRPVISSWMASRQLMSDLEIPSQRHTRTRRLCLAVKNIILFFSSYLKECIASFPSA